VARDSRSVQQPLRSLALRKMQLRLSMNQTLLFSLSKVLLFFRSQFFFTSLIDQLSMQALESNTISFFELMIFTVLHFFFDCYNEFSNLRHDWMVSHLCVVVSFELLFRIFDILTVLSFQVYSE
jgi:hypothetical protein